MELGKGRPSVSMSIHHWCEKVRRWLGSARDHWNLLWQLSYDRVSDVESYESHCTSLAIGRPDMLVGALELAVIACNTASCFCIVPDANYIPILKVGNNSSNVHFLWYSGQPNSRHAFYCEVKTICATQCQCLFTGSEQYQPVQHGRLRGLWTQMKVAERL